MPPINTLVSSSAVAPIEPAAHAYRLHFRKASGLATMRWLVTAGVLCLVSFLWWFFTTLRIGYAPLFWLLAISLSFKILRMAHEWIHYVQVRVPVPPAYTPPVRTVDVLTTACPGEPHAMIIRTLESMQAVRYPHTSYLCDEGDDPVLRAACKRLGVVHVTREVKVDAKAGNINNALRQATGDFCVVLDPDHVMAPDFLDQVMAYFEDPTVGFVQVVQAYGNQNESLVARGAAEQTYHFYGPLMMGMNGYGTVQAIGANCTFRRTALESIGGHAPGLTEDMHTAMRLHAGGWRSLYVPEVVSRGLVPASLAAFYSQQLKWSRGAFDLLFRVYPKLAGRFTWAQRLHYVLLPLYFFSGVVAMIDLLLPVLSLGLNRFPWLVNLSDLLLHVLPVLSMSLLIRCYAQRWLRETEEGGLHLAGGFLRVGTWWIYTLGFVYAVLGVKVPYLPTPKEGRRENEWLLAVPNLALAGLLIVVIKYGRTVDSGYYSNLMVGLALINIVILLSAAAMGQHQLVRNFVADMATQPYRRFVLSLDRLRATIVGVVVPLLRGFSKSLALGGFLVMSMIYALYGAWHARIPPLWVLAGDERVRVGLALPAGTVPALLEAPELSPGAERTYDIVALPLPAPTPTSELPDVVNDVASNYRVPLLSWPVRWVDMQQKEYCQHLARQIRLVAGPVLLRPLLSAPTASAYRRAWKQMVESFREEHAVNAVWVWTPSPTDSLLQEFPGAAYVNWIASPLLAGNATPQFAILRPRLTVNMTLHKTPVLLLAPAPTTAPLRAARRLAGQFPEIKAVVFPLIEPARSGTAPESKAAGGTTVLQP